MNLASSLLAAPPSAPLASPVIHDVISLGVAQYTVLAQIPQEQTRSLSRISAAPISRRTSARWPNGHRAFLFFRGALQSCTPALLVNRLK